MKDLIIPWYLFDSTKFGEINNESSMTVPDQAMTIEDILRNVNTIDHDPMSYHEGTYEDEPDIDNPNPVDEPDFDLTDYDDIQRRARETIESIKANEMAKPYSTALETETLDGSKSTEQEDTTLSASDGDKK